MAANLGVGLPVRVLSSLTRRMAVVYDDDDPTAIRSAADSVAC